MRQRTPNRFAVAALLAGSILLTGCASSTIIDSVPSGADLFINGQRVGTTPHYYRDSKIILSTTNIRLEKEGYETLYTSFSRDEQVAIGPLIGGVLFVFPFLWVMKYDDMHLYEMSPTDEGDYLGQEVDTDVRSKTKRLGELRALWSDGQLSSEDYRERRRNVLSKGR